MSDKIIEFDAEMEKRRSYNIGLVVGALEYELDTGKIRIEEALALLTKETRERIEAVMKNKGRERR